MDNIQENRKHTFSLGALSDYRQEIFGISTIWIMFFHAYLCGVKWPPALRLLRYGNMGVDIFLFISGTGLYYSFSKDRDVLGFYKRRVARLFLPICIICLPYWLYWYFTQDHSLTALIRRLLTLDFWIVGNQQIWFVSLIVVCYILYPLIYMLLFNFPKDGLLLPWLKAGALALLVVVALYGLELFYPDYFKLTEIALTRIPVFILGCAMGKCVFEKKEISQWWILLFAAVMVFVFWLLLDKRVEGIMVRYTYLFGGISVTMVLAFLFSHIHIKPLSIFLNFFAKMSLECYLVQIMAIRFYKMNVFFPFVEGSKKNYLLLMVIIIIVAFLASKLEDLYFMLVKKIKSRGEINGNSDKK